MRTVALLFVILLVGQAKGNIYYIDFTKISNDKKLQERFDKVKDNAVFYDHWTPEWSYEQKKEDFVQLLLEETYQAFSKINSSETENQLLLGTLSHYLYNLDATDYHTHAIEHYSKAISIHPKEYRSYWFLGTHYSSASKTVEGMENFLSAEKLLPKSEPTVFWENYAFAASLANMPSHTIFAMDKVKEISGSKGYFEEQLGDNIRNRIKEVDQTKNYKKEELWQAQNGEMLTFVSRPLGLKFLIDSTWGLSIYDYTNRQSAFVIKPSGIANDKGREITYSIAVLMKTVDSKDNLQEYMDNFVSKYPSKTKVHLADQYEKVIAYEIKDPSMYQDIGGGHMYMIAIERDAPRYPGLLLENPVSIPIGNNASSMSFYQASDSQDRFKGKIFYAVMLDSCEDIHKKSLAIFKEFLDKYLIIE